MITFEQLTKGIWADEMAEVAWWRKIGEIVATKAALRLDHEIMYGNPDVEPPRGEISRKCGGCSICQPTIGRTVLRIEFQDARDDRAG